MAFDYLKHAKSLLQRKKPKINKELLREEAFSYLEELRGLKGKSEEQKNLVRDLTRLVLTASDMLVTVDREKRAGLMKDIAKAYYKGDRLMACKDLKAVIKAGREHLTSLSSGNYAVHVDSNGEITYSYWHEYYVKVRPNCRTVVVMREPPVRTASRMIKEVLAAYGIEYKKDQKSYAFPEKIHD